MVLLTAIFTPSLFKLSDQLIFSPRYQLKLDHRLFQFFFQNNAQIDYQNNI